MIDKHKRSFILNVLRRGTYRWPGRWLAEKRSHLKEIKKYYCEGCGTISRKCDTQMDHIAPVQPVDGFDSWEGVLDRMYPAPEGWQRLCKPCHLEKSQHEGQGRTETRKSTKKNAKKNTAK